MEVYLIKDKATKTYYVEEDKPYFFAFSILTLAETFVKEHKRTEIDVWNIDTADDDEFLVSLLFKKGYQGGHFNGRLSLYNTGNHKELEGVVPTDSALLNLILFRNDKKHKERHLKSEVFYFFARINEEGYLLLADIDGYILAFSDLDNMQTSLIRALYQKGFEVIKYRLSKEKKYLINYNFPTQTFLEKNFEILGK